jgi:hypothetical protein
MTYQCSICLQQVEGDPISEDRVCFQCRNPNRKRALKNLQNLHSKKDRIGYFRPEGESDAIRASLLIQVQKEIDFWPVSRRQQMLATSRMRDALKRLAETYRPIR